MTHEQVEKAAREHQDWLFKNHLHATAASSFTMGASLVMERCKRLEAVVEAARRVNDEGSSDDYVDLDCALRNLDGAALEGK